VGTACFEPFLTRPSLDLQIEVRRDGLVIVERQYQRIADMQDMLMIAVAVGFGITAWLLLLLSDWLMGDKRQ
jgi:hypothetical protein